MCTINPRSQVKETYPSYILLVKYKNGKIFTRINVSGSEFNYMKDLKLCEESIWKHDKFYKTYNNISDFIITRESNFIDNFEKSLQIVSKPISKDIFINMLEKVYKYEEMRRVSTHGWAGNFWLDSLFSKQICTESQKIEVRFFKTLNDIINNDNVLPINYVDNIQKDCETINRSYSSMNEDFIEYEKLEALNKTLIIDKDEKGLKEISTRLYELRMKHAEWTTKKYQYNALSYLINILKRYIIADTSMKNYYKLHIYKYGECYVPEQSFQGKPLKRIITNSIIFQNKEEIKSIKVEDDISFYELFYHSSYNYRLLSRSQSLNRLFREIDIEKVQD